MANFNPGSYGVVLRILNGYLVATAPEFGITITKRFDDIRKREEIGTLYMDLVAKVSDEIKRRVQLGKPVPSPKKIPDLVPKNDPPTLSVADVARILQTSQDTVRRLVEDKKLKCTLTRGGHRRFRSSDVVEYAEKKDEAALLSTIKLPTSSELDQ